MSNSLDVAEIRLIAGSAKSVSRRGSPQLLAIGRLRADKGFDLLLRSFQLLQNEVHDAALTIIGDGPEKEHLHALAKTSGLRNLEFAGAIHDEQSLAPHFLGADFLVVAGAAGLSVNHALAYRLPVIAFRSGRGMPLHHPEIEYVVPDVSGVLVSTYSADALSTSIASAYSRAEHIRLARKIEDWTSAPSLDRMQDGFEKLLSVLLE